MTPLEEKRRRHLLDHQLQATEADPTASTEELHHRAEKLAEAADQQALALELQGFTVDGVPRGVEELRVRVLDAHETTSRWLSAFMDGAHEISADLPLKLMEAALAIMDQQAADEGNARAPTEWGWIPMEDEEVQGPFPDREAALEDARLYEYEKTLLGQVHWPDPGEYVSYDILDLAERMDISAAADGFAFWEDTIFLCMNSSVAEVELEGFMKSWARKHFSPTCWMLENVAEVDLFPERK